MRKLFTKYREIIVIVNYLFSKFFVFKNPRKDQPANPPDEPASEQPDTSESD